MDSMGKEPSAPSGTPARRHRAGRRARAAGRGMAPANGTRLYFACAGAESGPPLVLIPETGTDRRIWGNQVASFAEHYRVVRYDLRGWGRSPRRAGVYRHAQDLAALLDWLGIERAGGVALVGFRSGADIALELALDQPERVAALVLVEPWLSGWILARTRPAEFDAQVERLVAAAAEPNPAKRAVRFVATATAASRALARGTKLRRSWRRRWASLREWAIALESLPRTLAMLFGGPYTDWRLLRVDDPQDLDPRAASYFTRTRTPPVYDCLEQVSAPTLVVRGTPAASLALELDEELHARLAGAELALLADAPRLPHMIRPAAFNGVVLDFLRRVYPPR